MLPLKWVEQGKKSVGTGCHETEEEEGGGGGRGDSCYISTSREFYKHRLGTDTTEWFS